LSIGRQLDRWRHGRRLLAAVGRSTVHQRPENRQGDGWGGGSVRTATDRGQAISTAAMMAASSSGVGS
jgi:hypothetical protein